MRTLSLFLLVGALATTPAASSGYEVVTRDGQVHAVDGIEFAGATCVLRTSEGRHELPAADVDFYSTFVRNAETGAGNVVAFRTGALFRFETVEFRDAQVRIGLGEAGKVTIPEGLIDFEESVREGATLRLPRGETRFTIARGGEGGGGAVSTRASAGAGSASRRAASARSTTSRRLQRADASRRNLGRGRSSDADGRDASSYDDPSPSYEEVPEPEIEDAEPPDDGAGDAEEEDRRAIRERVTRDDNNMADADEVRRLAEEEGEASGTVSVIVGTSHSEGDVGGVQFTLHHPANCVPTTHQLLGSFGNAPLAMPNGSRPFKLAIVGQTNTTFVVPSDIARIEFAWTGTPPVPSDFRVASATASDPLGGTIAGFTAEVTSVQ